MYLYKNAEVYLLEPAGRNLLFNSQKHRNLFKAKQDQASPSSRLLYVRQLLLNYEETCYSPGMRLLAGLQRRYKTLCINIVYSKTKRFES